MKTSTLKKNLFIALATLSAGMTATSASASTPQEALVCRAWVSTETEKGPLDSVQENSAFALKADFKLNPRIDPRYPTAEIITDLLGTQEIRVLAIQAPDREETVVIQFRNGSAQGKGLGMTFQSSRHTKSIVVSRSASIDCSVE